MPPQTVARPFYRPASPELRFLPESPRQLSGTNRLGWVAIQYGRDEKFGSFNVLDLTTRENRSYPVPGRPGFFVETPEPHRIILGLERRLVIFDLETREVVSTLADLGDDPRVIINEGVGTPEGIFFGTKHLEFSQPIAALYHYGTTLRELRGGQVCSNGKYLRGDMLIDIDSQPRTITAYRYRAGGGLEFLRLIKPPESLPSVPDGLRPTPDGNSIIVAFFNPGHAAAGVAQQIRIADGEVEREWIVPGSPRVTCPTFVMLDGRLQLLFTTAAEGMPPETAAIAPEAGTMFLADF